MPFLLDATFFFTAMGILFLLPGFFLLCALLQKRPSLSVLEIWTLSFAVGLGYLNFLMILLGKSDILFTRTTLTLTLFGTLSLLAIVTLPFHNKSDNTILPSKATPSGNFSKKQLLLFITLLTLTVLIKTVYLSNAILPTATDLGHHMYWSKLIAETGKLPIYEKTDIVSDGSGTYAISEPEPIADFIIGEHLPFSAISILSKMNFFSAFPTLFLFFINLMTLLALFVLTRALAMDIVSAFPVNKIFTSQNIALTVLFLFGPLYTLASPQAKFVSGGVVGNTLGNLFIPLILFAYFRAFKEKRSDFLALGFFLTFSLAYIHHLSLLILLFTLGATIIIFLGLHWNNLKETLASWWTLLAQPKPLAVILSACLFFFLVALPTYIETQAIGTALGTPTKTTRTGLSFFQITSSSGEARVALGLVGLFLVALLRTRIRYGSAILLGWSLILLTMTMRPEWLFIDIPSNRIGSYLSFPLGLLAAFALTGCLALVTEQRKKFLLPGILVFFFSLAGFLFASGSGSFDNSQTLLSQNKALAVVETFSASRYLVSHTTKSDSILKDHNYIVGDAWMKLFFLRGYSYPLSRGFFKRYEDNPQREQCTLLMISVPNTPRGEKCYTETGTDFVVVNPNFDITPFEKSRHFSRVYTSPSIHIYKRLP